MRRVAACLAFSLVVVFGLAAVAPAAHHAERSAADLQSVLDRSKVDLPFNPLLAAAACPSERGPVKEGADADRFKVSTKVISTTINYLRGKAKPSTYPRNRRVGGAELHTYQLTAYLTQYKIESDGDIHLVLKDAVGRAMIAEIPLGSCVPTASRWKKSISSARARLVTTLHVTTSWHFLHRKITVRGIGMFDVPHGQSGAARNGIELHPVIGVSFTTSSPGGTAATATTATPTPTITVTPTPPSTSSGVVRISSIYFDSPGTDDGSNSSLNGEWVAITNGTSTATDMTSWTLSDSSSHTYVFPSFSLAAGATVKVHTGSGGDTAADLYWGSAAYIWNNTGDTGVLGTSGGAAVSSCAYTSGQDPQASC